MSSFWQSFNFDELKCCNGRLYAVPKKEYKLVGAFAGIYRISGDSTFNFNPKKVGDKKYIDCLLDIGYLHKGLKSKSLLKGRFFLFFN